MYSEKQENANQSNLVTDVVTPSRPFLIATLRAAVFLFALFLTSNSGLPSFYEVVITIKCKMQARLFVSGADTKGKQ